MPISCEILRTGADEASFLLVLNFPLRGGKAERIYAAFRERERIHPAVDSAAWAFERLRPPHLLLEFVYLITHGQMLEDRLRDQVREFSRISEDPRKGEVLRIAALSNALGAPVPVEALLRVVPLRDDPQEVVESLLVEYLTLEDGMLGPLHWVRSEHLARILHEGGVPSVTSSALTAAILAIASGLLEAGERSCFDANRKLFDEAHAIAG